MVKSLVSDCPTYNLNSKALHLWRASPPALDADGIPPHPSRKHSYRSCPTLTPTPTSPLLSIGILASPPTLAHVRFSQMFSERLFRAATWPVLGPGDKTGTVFAPRSCGRRPTCNIYGRSRCRQRRQWARQRVIPSEIIHRRRFTGASPKTPVNIFTSEKLAIFSTCGADHWGPRQGL